MIERLSLNSLKFFYYVALYESVTIAANKLFVTQSAVSKQIKNLEQMLGFDLFIRETRQIKLTKQGEKLLESCQFAFQQIDLCLHQLQTQHQNSMNKNLVVSCEPTIAMKWLIPRLPKFKKLHAEFDVTLFTAGGQINFQEQQIDLALRRNDFDWGSTVYAEKIADELMVVVGKAENMNSLERIYLTSSRAKLWQNFTHHQVLNTHYEKHYLEHFYLCIEACLAGMGTTIVSAYMVEKELEYHILKPQNSIYLDNSAYYMLSGQPIGEDPRKIIFVEWLKNEMTQSYLNCMSLDKKPF